MQILFIQTGGTIDKDYPKADKGYNFEITEPSIFRILQKINPCFEYTVSTLIKKDSSDITNDDRKKLLTFQVPQKQNHKKVQEKLIKPK